MQESPLDSTVFQAFKQGDHKAFKLVYKHFVQPINYFCYNLTGSTEDAKDIALDSIYKVLKLHTQFETYVDLKAFLYLAARNACFDYLRAEKRNQQKRDEYTEVFTEIYSENLAIEAEFFHAVRQEIKKLPEKCGQVFALLFLEGLTPKEVSEKMNITLENVYSQKKIATKRLRLALTSFVILYIIGVYLTHFLQH